ncbi:MAG: DUF3108 domain-containing protein [Rhizobiales bacterium]|nr:DUF3108 domain-containing protein [Hyphomicrobiales bacterium]
MIAILAPHRRAAAGLAGALLCLIAGVWPQPAAAQGRLKATYDISMTGVSIGRIVWRVDIDEKRYIASAQGKASGMLSVLVSGEGSVVTQGVVADGRMIPSDFISRTSDDEGSSELRMTFEDGAVKEVIGPPPPPDKRVAVTEADRRGVSDPLTAVLIPARAGGDALARGNCDRVLPIFDGRRRYNLALSFKRLDRVRLARGFSGPILVCGVILQPISGHRADSMLVKYLAGRRDLELWFAPIAGSAFIAPIRVLLPTLLGTLEIAAEQFDAVAMPTPQ